MGREAQFYLFYIKQVCPHKKLHLLVYHSITNVWGLTLTVLVELELSPPTLSTEGINRTACTSPQHETLLEICPQLRMLQTSGQPGRKGRTAVKNEVPVQSTS